MSPFQVNRLYCNNKCSISLSGENVQIFPSKKYDMTSMPNSTFDFANTCTCKSRSAKFIIKQSRKQYLALIKVRLHICNSTFDFGNTCSCKSRSTKFMIKQSNKLYLALNIFRLHFRNSLKGFNA